MTGYDSQGQPATFYAPGPPGAGVAVRACVRVGCLCLSDATGDVDKVPLASPHARPGGYDGRQWFLDWQTAHGRASLALADIRALRALVAEAPVGACPGIEADIDAARSLARGSRLGLLLLVLLLLMPLWAIGLLWAQGDRLSDWVSTRVSPAHEQWLGDIAFAQMRGNLRLRRDGPAPALVHALGARLTAGTRYRYQWWVAESPEVNAFALPGGYVVVYSGLIKLAENPAQLAGVLAHEVQHVEQRHALRQLVHSLGWRASLALVLGDVAGAAGVDIGGHLLNLAYSRDLERAADLGALPVLRRARLPADGMLEFFAGVAQREGGLPTLLASHPATQERMATLRAAIEAQGRYPVELPEVDWAALQASL